MSPHSSLEWPEYQSFTCTDSFKVNCAFPPPPLFYMLPRLCYVTVTCDWFGAFTLCFARTAVVFTSGIILKSSSAKISTRLGNSEKIEFLQTHPEWSPTGTSYKNIVLSSLNQKFFFLLRFFSFQCTKSAKIDWKWAAYSEARKLKSKAFHEKLIVPRIFTFLYT